MNICHPRYHPEQKMGPQPTLYNTGLLNDPQMLTSYPHRAYKIMS